MKSIKKLKKYGTAIAGSALLVGATLTGAAAANHGGSSGMTGDLSDYPHPFVDEDGNIQSSIVVGEDAATADVVGAIDIAGSLSQAAFTEEEIEGGGSVSGAVDGETLDEEVIGTDFSGSADASDASFMVRETVTDDDDDDVFVTETASVSGVESRINGTTTDFDVQGGEVTYSTSYSPGFEVNDTLMLMGEEYELTAVDSGSEIDLGSTEEATGLAVGGSYEHGPYMISVEGGNSDNGDILVNVMEDGDQVESGQLSQGETLDVDDDFDVTAETAFYSSGSESWSIALESTYTDTTLEEGEDLPLDADYEVHAIDTSGTSNNVVTGITVDNVVTTTEDPDTEDDERTYVEAGEQFEGPAGYFGVHNLGLSDEATTDVEFGTETEVTFEDVNNQEHTFDMVNLVSGDNPSEDKYIGVPAEDSTGEGTTDYMPVEVASTGGTVELVHNEFDEEYDVSNAPNTADGVGGGAGNNYDGYESATTNAGVAYRTVDTGYGFSVTIEWVNDDGTSAPTQASEVDEVNFYNGDYDGTGSNDESQMSVQAQNKVTTENGAELSWMNADPADANNAGASDSTTIQDQDGSPGSNVPVVELSEGTGASSADTGIVQVWYDDDGNNGDFFNDADDGEIGAVHYNGLSNKADGTTITLGDVEDGDSTLTHFGTSIDLQGSNTVELSNPDEQRYQEVGIGRPGSSGDTGGDSAMSMSPTYGDSFPTTGALDTDERVGQVKENDNVIVVGGPAINDLTAELAAENQTWDAETWRTGGYEGTSLLQMVDGWNDEQSALVVAGHSAEDTRTAAEFLANYGDHSDALSGESQVQISTETGNVVE